MIAGWGFSNRSHNITPAKLQALQVKIDGWNVCKRRWHGDIEHFHICAWVPRLLNKGACHVIQLLTHYIYMYIKKQQMLLVRLKEASIKTTKRSWRKPCS